MKDCQHSDVYVGGRCVHRRCRASTSPELQHHVRFLVLLRVQYAADEAWDQREGVEESSRGVLDERRVVCTYDSAAIDCSDGGHSNHSQLLSTWSATTARYTRRRARWGSRGRCSSWSVSKRVFICALSFSGVLPRRKERQRKTPKKERARQIRKETVRKQNTQNT